jgi:formamidopyrimidine-DNA glycosylase
VPEAPDLFVVREFLEARLTGRKIIAGTERRPLVLRNMTGPGVPGFSQDIAGRPVTAVRRRGKLLTFGLGPERLLIVSPMLTGALRYCEPQARMEASAHLVFDLDDGMQLRYLDEKRMGQVYYLPPHRLGDIVRLDMQGPDVLDEPLDFAAFRRALKPFRGEIKGVLTRGHAVSGIGNAYSDEVLFAAKLYPFRKVTRLSDQELHRLHASCYEVPRRAVATLRERIGADIHKKVRDFLQVHGKGGEPCPRCGTKITAITANQRETNYCRGCQPGSLIEG